MYNNNRVLTLSSDLQDWSMLEEYNLTIDDMLESLGFANDSRWFDWHVELFLVVAFSLAIFLGLVGNVLVAFILCRRGNLRSPRHWYLINLVASDILTCVFCVPFTLLRLTLKDWRLGEVLCRVAPFLQLTYIFVSIFTILAIAVERYRAIVCFSRPNSHRHRVAHVVIPAIWLLAVSLATPLVITHRLEHVHNVTEEVILTLCIEQWDSDTLLGLYTVLILMCQYAVPAATIITLHLLICRFLRTRVHLRANSKKNRQKMARHRKNLMLLTAISITFAVQWLPITAINIIADFGYTVFPSASAFCLTYALCLLFALASVFINPVIYGCFNSSVRRDMLAVCNINNNTSSDSSTRPGSSEVTSRFYTTFVGLSAVGKHHSSADSDIMAVSPARHVPMKNSRQRQSVDGLLHVPPSRDIINKFRKQRMSLQLELK